MDSWHLPNLSVQIAPDCISEYLNFQNFPGGMPPNPPSKSRLRRSKWALSRPYCQYSELCHARAYKQKKARNAPAPCSSSADPTKPSERGLQRAVIFLYSWNKHSNDHEAFILYWGQGTRLSGVNQTNKQNKTIIEIRQDKPNSLSANFVESGSVHTRNMFWFHIFITRSNY